MDKTIPETIAQEHRELHERLLEAKRAGGRTGEAAKRAAKVIHPHFLAEEEFALPPIMVLHDLIRDDLKPEMRHIIKLSEHLKADMPRMLQAHRDIAEALDELASVAELEGKPEVVRFARDVKEHAKHEEEVLYPAAVMVGEYLKLRFAQEDAEGVANLRSAGTRVSVPASAARRGMFRLF